MTIEATRRFVRDRLRSAGIEAADHEARVILSWILSLSSADMIIHAHAPVSDGHMRKLNNIILRRIDGEPLDHIQGFRDFYGRRFDISANVLSPRQDTETLIEACLAVLPDSEARSILDLGVGSGAVIITLLAERAESSGFGVDISKAAIETTLQNAKRHDVAQRLSLSRGDWFGGLDTARRFDLIVSNPPYITDKAMKELPVEVLKFDPAISLSGGKNGLDSYRSIINSAPNFLNAGGALIFEIGFDQGETVAALLRDRGFNSVSVKKDLAGQDRVVGGFWPEL